MPAAKLEAVAVIELAHAKLYGEVPPVALAVAVPFAPLLASVVVVETRIAEGWVMLNEPFAVQWLASVTVTV